MAKKKREHVVFDGMRKVKKSLPFGKINKQTTNPLKKKYICLKRAGD